MNEFRFYDLRLARELWGTWTLVRHWGRIGVVRPGKRIKEFVRYHDTRQVCRSQAQRRHKRGYRQS